MGSERQQKYLKMHSYGNIWAALSFLGVETFAHSKIDDSIDDLIANFLFEQTKQMSGFSFEFDREDLVYRAHSLTWGLDELKAIAGRWMAGKDENKLLRRGKDLFKMEFHA
jgi:replicative DNA helicase